MSKINDTRKFKQSKRFKENKSNDEKDGERFRKGKKRKAPDSNEVSSEQRTSKVRLEGFTEIEFKVMLRDPETLVSGLEQFIEAAEKCIPGSKVYDTVEGFCRSSADASEICHLLDGENRKLAEYQLIFQCLEKILLRIASDLPQYISVGIRIVKRLFPMHTGKVYFTLNEKNRSTLLKTTLKMLTAMVMVKDVAAQWLLNHFDFAHHCIKPLFARRDNHDDEDVRTCALHFIMSFLLTEKNDIILQIMEKQGVLGCILEGIMYDRVSSIQIVLATLLDKVVKNETMSLSMKQRMFTGRVLRQLALLYNWKGPSRWKESIKNNFHKGQKRKKKDQIGTETEEFTEDKQQVCELVHDFLEQLCTSHTHGLFCRGPPKSRAGTQSLSNLLEYLSTVSLHKLVQELVVKILSLCPDHVQQFVTKISHTLTPRPVINWVNSVAFLCKVYEGLPIQSVLDQLDGHKPLTELTGPLLKYTLPMTQVLDMVRDGLKEKGLAINYVTLGMVKQVGECVVRALDLVRQASRSAGYPETDVKDALNLYTDTVIKALPHAHTVFMFWDKVQSQLTDKADQKELQQLKELAGTDVLGVLVKIEQVLCLYQTLNPALLVNNSFALGKLLDGILNTSLSASGEESGSTYLPQMYLLKLLAGTDAGRLPFSKQNSSHHSLLYQLLELVPRACDDPKVKQVTPHLLCQLLEKTGSFESSYDELMVWLGNLQVYGQKTYTSSPVLEFVAKVILRYMSNPFPYMDKVCDIVSEVNVMETKGGHSATINKMEDIADINLDDLADLGGEDAGNPKSAEDVAKRFPFCPMLLVALETLEKLEDIHQDVKAYMSSVLLEIFHQQVDRVPLCTLSRSFKTNQFLPGVVDYLKLWLSDKKSSKSKKRVDVCEDGLLVTEVKLSALYTSLGKREMGNQGVIQQYLAHIAYLTSHTDIVNLKEQLNRLTDSIETAVQKIWETEEGSRVEYMKDFSLLDIQKESKTQELTKAIELVLNDPRIRDFYYKEILDRDVPKITKTVAHSLTKLATSIMKLGQKYELDLETSTEYFQCRLLTCLQHEAELQDGHQHLKHIYHGLKAVVVSISGNQCVHVLEKVLALSTRLAQSESSHSVCAIINTLLKKIIAEDSSNIEMNKSSMERLIRCYINETESNSNALLEEFFTKYPNLLVLVDTEIVGDILQSSLNSGLLYVLVIHNVYVRETLGEMIVQNDSRFDTEKHLPAVLAFLEMVRPDELEQKQEVLKKIAHVYKKTLQGVCETSESDNCEDLVKLCRRLRRLGALGHKLQKKMEQSLLTTLASADSIQTYHVDLLQTLYVRRFVDNEEVIVGKQRLLVICIQSLARVLKKREKGQELTENKLLEMLASFTARDMTLIVAVSDVWPKFLKYSLKHYYTDGSVLRFLAKALPVIYRGDTDGLGVTMETVVTMVMSHSSYFSVMFDEETEACKDALLNVLLVLIEGCPSECDKEQIGILLGAYGATLSCTDQKILQLLQLYEKNGVPFIEFKPFLWGGKAIEYQQMGKEGQNLHHRQPGMRQVISNLDPDRMRNTINNFPYHRKLQTVKAGPADLLGTSTDCYDPCFLLPLLSHLLSSESLVHCKTFIDWDCLSFTLVALSSHDDMTRMAAYHILDKFRTHLEGATLARKDQVMHVLDLLHNSVGESKLRLASIVTMFLARTVKLIFKPGTHMYGIINAFLMHKPKLDMEEVPEFYKLFQSSAWEYRTERLWILTLLHDGLKDKDDYVICEKKQIFKLLQTFYESSMADTDCQLKVLQIMLKACREPDIATDLVRHHGLLTWISLISTQLSADCDKQVELLVSIVSSIRISLLRVGQTIKLKLSAQMLTTLQSILWIIRRCSIECLLDFVTTLQCVVQDMRVSSSIHTENTESPPTISLADMLVLLYHTRKYITSRLAPGPILAALTALGYSTTVLHASKGDHSDHTKGGVHEPETEAMETSSDKAKNGGETSDQAENSEKTDEEENLKETEAEATEQKEMILDLNFVVLELLLTVNTEISFDSVKSGCHFDSVQSQNGDQLSEPSNSHQIETTSALVIQIAWLVGQFRNPGTSIEIINRSLAWIKDLLDKQTSVVLLKTLTSRIDLSCYIVTSLVNTYAHVFNSQRTENLNEDEINYCKESLECLNHILVAVASHYFARTVKEQKEIAAFQSETGTSGCEAEKQSIALRQMFVNQSMTTQEVTKLLKQNV